MFSSRSKSEPLRSCCSTLQGQMAPSAASRSARGTSMMISFSVGFFTLLIRLRYSRPTEPMYPATYRKPIVGSCSA